MRRSVACLPGLVISLFTLLDPAAAMVPPESESSPVDCLALAIYWEARSEPAEGQLAIAHIAINRVAHPGFPNDICEVVKQGGEAGRGRCQFSWWCDGRDDTPRDLDAWRRAKAQAAAALRGETEDPTGGAIYFHHEGVRPSWAEVKERTARIGRHIFYR